MRFVNAFVYFCVFFALISNAFSQNQEFRSTWVITWNHISAGNTVEQNKALVREILDNHQKANMNAVLWQVRQSGTVYYPSDYEPWGRYAGYQDPGYDHLAYAIAEAHKRGMEIHAWFNVFQASETIAGAPAAEHPEWICRDESGIPMPAKIALSPGLAEVRAYLIKVAMEIVRNYDIDGLHLDYVRWNEYSESNINSKTKKSDKYLPLDGMIPQIQIEDLVRTQSGRYLYDINHPFSGGVPQGFASWEEWWRWSVTDFVKVLHDSIQAVKPWVRLSPAALGRYNWGGWNGYHVVYQDAALWFNEGYIDQLTPMHYHWTTGDGFYSMLENDWKPNILKGINAGRLFTVGPGSYILSENNIWNRHPQIVQRSRDVAWTDGFQFFSYSSWQSHRYWSDAAGLFFINKTKIRTNTHSASVKPNNPQLSLNKLDSLTYQLTVIPDNATSDDGWFAIYRAESDAIDPASDPIINIHFGQDTYQFYDTFTGLQDYNASYYYYAGAFNRYWDESQPSDVVAGDPLPSFAPQVLQSTPEEGDTVSVNSSVQLSFSKTMQPAGFMDEIETNPAISIQSMVWSDGDKEVSIIFAGNFTFDTEYQLTIGANVTDINGRKLDGNGDGVEGDPYTITFRTKAVDIEGPGILYSNIFTDGSTNDFDTQGVLSVIFDEQVADNTINEKSVFIMQNEDTLEAAFLLFDQKERSELSVQPKSPFLPGRIYALHLTTAITDTLGNPLESNQIRYFQTEFWQYELTQMIDDFTSGAGEWWEPEGSGSTTGVIESETNFGSSSALYLPTADRPIKRKSARLTYSWDPVSSNYLLREYLGGGSAREVIFDTSYVLQCYVYGDGSYNKFRFAIDDKYPVAAAENHEVSPWYVIDWIGWKLVSWELKPENTGIWLGNGILEGNLRFDSFQMTHEASATLKDAVYFKDLRLVKKSYLDPAPVKGENKVMPDQFSLNQNYPNPFNPVTSISFTISEQGLTELVIYDITGRRVQTLLSKQLLAGSYTVQFDGSGLASGTYIYLLRSRNQSLVRKMILVK